jgi:spore germination protein KC
LVAKKGQLTDLCSSEALSKVSSNPGKSIMEIVQHKPSCSIISANTLGDSLNMTWEKGGDTYTAGVDLIKKSTEKTNVFDISIGDTAVFKNENFSGWLNDEETMGLLSDEGKIKGGSITVNIQGENISFIINKARSKVKPEIVDNKMKVVIEINIESKLAESQARLDFTDPNVLKSIQDALKEKVKAQIVSAFERTQEFDSDVFGFGNYFYGKYPKFWKQIEANGIDYYRDLSIELNIETKQWNLGLVK